MRVHAYTEDQLVEQPAIGLFAELGWQVVWPHSHPGPLLAGDRVTVDESGLLGRETRGEVVLVGRFRAAIECLNSALLLDWNRWPKISFGISSTADFPGRRWWFPSTRRPQSSAGRSYQCSIRSVTDERVGRSVWEHPNAKAPANSYPYLQKWILCISTRKVINSCHVKSPRHTA